MNHLKDWMALNMGTPGSASMEQNKDLLLDTLDKIYGEDKPSTKSPVPATTTGTYPGPVSRL